MGAIQTRFSKKWAVVLAAVLSVFILVLAAMETHAAPLAPANLRQTSAFGSYAKVRWDAVSGTAVKYQVEVSQDQKNWAALGVVTNSCYTLSKMETGKPYYVRVCAVTGAIKGAYSPALLVITQPGYISTLKQTSASTTSVKVSWSASAGAGAYDVWVGTTEDNMKYKQTVKTTSTTIKGLKKNKTYIVKVVPFNIAGNFRTNGFEKANENVRTVPTAVTGLKVFAWNCGSKNITVEWKPKTNVDGYEVRFYNSSNKLVKKVAVKGAAKYKATYTKAAANTFYKAKIRSYITVDGKKKYSAYSKYTICAVAQPQLTGFKQSTGKLEIAWAPVTGATSYSVYITTGDPNYPSSYVKVADVDKNVISYSMSKFGANDINVYDSYFGYVVAKKKVGSKTYSSKVTKSWMCPNNY